MCHTKIGLYAQNIDIILGPLNITTEEGLCGCLKTMRIFTFTSQLRL